MRRVELPGLRFVSLERLHELSVTRRQEVQQELKRLIIEARSAFFEHEFHRRGQLGGQIRFIADLSGRQELALLSRKVLSSKHQSEALPELDAVHYDDQFGGQVCRWLLDGWKLCRKKLPTRRLPLIALHGAAAPLQLSPLRLGLWRDDEVVDLSYGLAEEDVSDIRRYVDGHLPARRTDLAWAIRRCRVAPAQAVPQFIEVNWKRLGRAEQGATLVAKKVTLGAGCSRRLGAMRPLRSPH